jgi:hypothetical protein
MSPTLRACRKPLVKAAFCSGREGHQSMAKKSMPWGAAHAMCCSATATLVEA